MCVLSFCSFVDIDIIDLARQSAGFVLGDYLELFSQAYKIATNDISLLMKKWFVYIIVIVIVIVIVVYICCL